VGGVKGGAGQGRVGWGRGGGGGGWKPTTCKQYVLMMSYVLWPRRDCSTTAARLVPCSVAAHMQVEVAGCAAHDFILGLQGGRTLTGWPHTQPSKLDCSGPEA
jgi:hypothetical protein